MKYSADRICRILHILRKPNSIIVLLFLQNNSKFKNKLKHANLGRCKFISIKHLYREVQGIKVCKYTPNSRCCPSSCFLAVLAMFLGQHFEVKRVKCSATVPPFGSNYQNNSTSSPGFLGQRFNNLQPGCTFDVILTSSVQYDKTLFKFRQQQLVMVNYACGFNQSETGKYFERIIRIIITKGYKE